MGQPQDEAQAIITKSPTIEWDDAVADLDCLLRLPMYSLRTFRKSGHNGTVRLDQEHVPDSYPVA